MNLGVMLEPRRKRDVDIRNHAICRYASLQQTNESLVLEDNASTLSHFPSV